MGHFNHTLEAKAKRLAALRAKLPNGYWYGKKRSPEDREKMRLAKLNKTGPTTNNWRGGITPIREKIRKMKEYIGWRVGIFTKDDFTCAVCGIRGGDLVADHYPKMFAEILDYHKIKTLGEARRCDELWSMNNGRTLCVPCHKKTFTGVPKKPWQKS